MKKSQSRKPFLFKITNRGILFLYSLLLVIFFFYAAGNGQGLTDESQKLLLNTVRALSAVLFFFLFAGFTQITVYLFKTANRKLIGFIFLYLLFFITSFVLFVFASGALFFAK